MLENEHLAIASVPIQKWGQIYDEKEALENGTIFPELNKPFFITERDNAGGQQKFGEAGNIASEVMKKSKTALDSGTENSEQARKREAKLLEIQQISFVLDDVRLFMDTHPADKQGLSLLKKTVMERKKLLKEYALQFEPLTMDCMADIYGEHPNSGCYCWQKGPAPWEGVCV